VSPVCNLEYWEFVLNLGDMKELHYINNSSAICPKFEKINLRRFTSNLNQKNARQCAWGDFSDYNDDDRTYPPMERGRQLERVKGSRYKYNRPPYSEDRYSVHEPFFEEKRYDYGMTDSSRAYNTTQSQMYYQGSYRGPKKYSDRPGPYAREREYQYDDMRYSDLDSRKWADMTPPPSPSSCHKIAVDSVYDI
tara:strand:+ start:137 stop:715 length:579 start_codon:yes stop_codon:yes gene_type:complete